MENGIAKNKAQDEKSLRINQFESKICKIFRLVFCLILSMASSLGCLVQTLSPEQRKAFLDRFRELEKSFNWAMQNW